MFEKSIRTSYLLLQLLVLSPGGTLVLFVMLIFFKLFWLNFELIAKFGKSVALKEN